MAEKKAAKEQREDAPDLSPHDADAPGPITPEHESGSFEQTLAEQEARQQLADARAGKSSAKSSAKPATAKPASSSS